MDDYHTLAYACLAVIVAIYVVRWYNDPLRAIPTVGGPSLPVLSYLGAWRMRGDCRDIIEEGYRKHAGSVFKIPSFYGWTVIVSGRNMVEEITRKRPDDSLSGPHASVETLSVGYLVERPVYMDPYHTKGMKEKLGRKLATVMPDVFEEVAAAVGDHIVAGEDDWTSVLVMQAMHKIATRTSNRAIVGLPLCRNEAFLAVAADFAMGFLGGIDTLSLFPRFMRPIVALFIHRMRQAARHAVPFLLPIIQERQKAMAELGEEWNDKPNDLLQSFLDNYPGKKEPTLAFVQRVLTADFSAVHTSALTLTHALYHVAENPGDLQALREEIETAISADGGGCQWTSTALGNMWKLDSLFRETLRFHGVGTLILRKAMKDVTLSDGTRLPEGTIVHAFSYALHREDALYEHARTFDPFRFARMRSAQGGPDAKHQCASTSPEYIPFGHGAHACPGRFFAASQMKAILGYIILNFDVKFAQGDGGRRPPNIYLPAGSRVVPAPHGRVLFKKRKTLV